MVTTAGKQHRREPFLATLSHDEVGSPLLFIARYLIVNLSTAPGPAMGAIDMCFKPALVKVDDVVAAIILHPPAQLSDKPRSFTVIYLRVLHRFF